MSVVGRMIWGFRRRLPPARPPASSVSSTPSRITETSAGPPKSSSITIRHTLQCPYDGGLQVPSVDKDFRIVADAPPDRRLKLEIARPNQAHQPRRFGIQIRLRASRRLACPPLSAIAAIRDPRIHRRRKLKLRRGDFSWIEPLALGGGERRQTQRQTRQSHDFRYAAAVSI